MRITVSAIAKLFHQNMGSLKYFNTNLLPLVTLYTPSLSGRTQTDIHNRNNFSGVVNDVMRRCSVKGCSALAILRGLYIPGETRYRPFPFSLWWWRCNSSRSSRIRVHPTPSPIQIELSSTSSGTPCLLNSTPTRLKLVCLWNTVTLWRISDCVWAAMPARWPLACWY